MGLRSRVSESAFWEIWFWLKVQRFGMRGCATRIGSWKGHAVIRNPAQHASAAHLNPKRTCGTVIVACGLVLRSCYGLFKQSADPKIKFCFGSPMNS